MPQIAFTRQIEGVEVLFRKNSDKLGHYLITEFLLDSPYPYRIIAEFPHTQAGLEKRDALFVEKINSEHERLGKIVKIKKREVLG